ncbi:MAG: hypothetical protein M3069_24940 [Chloroflexota bacterium]|nr:hypothetical protein [Chloroflexota bacterium]
MSTRGLPEPEFRVGVMCGISADILRGFLARNAPRLREAGIEVPIVILDEDRAARQSVRHLWRLAKRQARVAGCSRLTAAMRLLVYRGLTHEPGSRARPSPELAPDLRVVRVPTLNSPVAADALNSAGCNLVCLMGARILTRRTLEAIAAPILNIHSSDPRLIRGGPVVVWEVLAGHSEIALVVHEVVAAVDSGAIVAQGAQQVLYRRGLGATTHATMKAARPKVGDLFEQAIRDMAAGAPRRIRFDPGPLKVTPSVRETLRAELLCRQRSRSADSRPTSPTPCDRG